MRLLILLLSGLFSFVFISVRYFSFLDPIFSFEIYTSKLISVAGITINLLAFSPLILVFALLTFWAPLSVFRQWWKFAKYAIPIVLLMTFVLNLQLHHSPYKSGFFVDLEAGFDRLFVQGMYLIFAFVSGLIVTRAWLRERKNLPQG